MRSFIATLVLVFGVVAAFGQQMANAEAIVRRSGIGGSYRCVRMGNEADSTVIDLKLDCNPGCKSGNYTLTKTDVFGVSRRVDDEKTGKWYMLDNRDSAKDANVLLIVLDMLGPLETYPIFSVEPSGNLMELNQPNPERFPLHVSMKNNKLYIMNRHGKALPLDKARKYKDIPAQYLYRRHS